MTENDFILFDRIEVIKKTIEKYGEENFYISFSGGKDSTVLHHLIDEAIPGNQIPRVFMNTGIEYNDIRRFVEELTENDFRFVIVNSKVNIPQMLKEKGYPFKSKFHAEQVRRFQLKGDFEKTNRNYYEGVKASGVEVSAKFKCPEILKYQFSKDFNIPLSPNCCNELKKKPLHKWEEENKRKIAIIGLRQAEGGIRSMHEGCILTKNNVVVKFKPLNPVNDDWMEWYIKERNIKLCKLYYPPYNFQRTGCKGCVYEHFENYEEPCLLCKCTFKQGTPGYREAKDYFKPKKYSSDCTISCKEPNDSFKNEDYESKEIDMVNHPPHYQHGIEPIEFIESHNLNFNLGSAVKYIARAPYKGTELLDLKKAKWFIEREIKRHDK